MPPDIAYAAFLIGPSGKITTWNTACQEILGYTERDVLMRTFTSLLTAPTKKDCQESLKNARNIAAKLEAQFSHPDGRNTTVTLTFVPQFRKSGKFSGYSVIIGPTEDLSAIPEPELVGSLPLKQMIDFLAGTFYVINQSGNFVMWNKKVEKATQLTTAAIKKIPVIELFKPEEQKHVANKIREVFENDGEILVEANLISKKGTTTPYLFTGSRFMLNNQYYLCGMGLDNSERDEQEQKLRLRDRALHSSSNGIIITRCVGDKNPIEYVNTAFEKITGYLAHEVMGRDPRFMAAPGLDDGERAKMKMAMSNRKEIHIILRNLRKNGEVYWNDLTIRPVLDAKGIATHFIGVINDITEAKNHTMYLEHEINHDVLTGLANRNLLSDRLEQALHVARRNKTMVAMTLIDLDNFKLINDTMGHNVGDEVLKVVARRLKASVRDSDTVARLGGDEFLLILADQPSLGFTVRMIERLRQDMAKPIVVDNNEIDVEASIGVSVFPHDGTKATDLMQAADAAMYQAKASGRNAIHFFSPDMKACSEVKDQLEMSMRHAVEKEELFLVFQPRLCLKMEKIVGAEALLRWRHPEQGILLPASFIPAAEENGLIIPFGEWVFNTVCAMLQQLKHRGFSNLVVSMNVSFREFSQKNFVARLGGKLAQCELPPEMLELEVQEAHLMRNPQLSRDILAEISQLGIKLAVDHFGAGMSSLSDFQKLPFNHLKISRSIIESIRQDSMDGIMAKTMIGIGHSMNLDVIAEGVETSKQRDFLKQHGCDQMQGNYFSEPITLSAFEQLLTEAHA